MTKEIGLSLISLVLLSVTVLIPANSQAYVLGGITIHSSINEPLDAEIPITDISSEELAGLRLQLLNELAELNLKKTANRQNGLSLIGYNLAAVVKVRNGQPFIHVTSDRPLYSHCSKLSFNCYQFHKFNLTANWRSQSYLINRVKRSYAIIPQMDHVLGDFKLSSGIGEPLKGEITLLKETDDLKDLNVRLAPKEAWIRGLNFGEKEYNVAKKLRIKFNYRNNKLHIRSKNSVNRVHTNRIQTNNAPLVLLLEISWPDGHEIKKYTIYMPV